MQIYPLLLGEREANLSNFMYLADPGRTVRIAYYAWLVIHEDQPVLIDVGFSEEAAQARGVTMYATLHERLLQLNVVFADIRTVVLSHLHWDHADNIMLFPNARFYVQETELNFVQSSYMRNHAFGRFYNLEQLQCNLGTLSGKIIPISGEMEVIRDINLCPCPGHTPGMQIVKIGGGSNVVVLCSDASPLSANLKGGVPPGIATNMLQAADSLEDLRGLEVKQFYWGHDPEACSLETVY